MSFKSQVYRIYIKQHRSFWPFLLARLKGQSSLQVEISGIALNLSYSVPYHFAFAKAMQEGYWERELISIWIQESMNAELIFDIGAFCGVYGLFAAKANPKASIVMFEPDPINAYHIRRNLKINSVSNARLVEAVASEADGTINFAFAGSTGSKVVPWGTPKKCVKVSSYGSARLMKIDTEGHEPEILRGSDLSNTKIICSEMQSGNEVRQMLSKLGFQEARYNENSVFRRE
jgi:FkbM family methyltransferase